MVLNIVIAVCITSSTYPTTLAAVYKGCGKIAVPPAMIVSSLQGPQGKVRESHLALHGDDGGVRALCEDDVPRPRLVHLLVLRNLQAGNRWVIAASRPHTT